MNPESGHTPRHRISFWFKELGLYAVLAVFLAIAPLMPHHWLVVFALSWILALVIIGRMIQVVTAKTGADAGPLADSIAERQFDGRTPIAAGITYLAILLVMWAPFALSSGMGYETGFSYYSEKSTLMSGFVDIGDPMRPFTNLFYHGSYLLGLFLGVPGSFAPFQFVYAALWWARGMLTFLILRRVLGGSDFLCFLCGALVLVHASDGALQWVGQMNQFGYMFWMLLGIYFFLRAEDANTTPVRVYVWMMLACAGEFFCLWSYESALALLMLIPPLIYLARRRLRVRFLVTSAAWYGIAGVYILLTIQKYLNTGSTTYQASVMRTDWKASSLFADLLFNMKNSLFFWLWPDIGPLDMPRSSVTALSIAGVVVILIGGVLVAALRNRRDVDRPPVASDRTLLLLLACGVLVLIASFPVYLLLSSVRLLWRTQFLSGFGTAIVLACAAGLIFNRTGRRRRWMRYAGCLGVASAVTYAGVHRAVELGSVHRGRWQLHRRVVADIVRAVPQVKPGTLLVICGIPHNADPFGDTMWLDMALRLSYPGTRVAGVYFYREDGAPAPGSVFRIHGDVWVKEETGYPPLIEDAEAGDVVVLEYDGRSMRVLPAVPSYMCAEACDTHDYHPESRIIHGKPSPRAINRYGPI